MSPTVLVVTTSFWFSTARLAMALAKAGCNVEGVCPPRHPLSKTSAVRRTHTYYSLAPLICLADAIQAANPDLIISGDDLSTRQLHLLYQRECGRKHRGNQTCALIERSFGSPENFGIVYERASFMRLADEEGIRAPRTSVIASVGDLRRWIAEMDFPVVLKADGSSGGAGVRIVKSLRDAELAFQALQAPPVLARAVKRALLNNDKTLIWPSLLRRRSVVSAQTFVEGREATSTVACWKGVVLAGLHFEVVNKQYAAGPSTVLRQIENPEMSAAVEKMVHRLNLSGLHGFDFMLEAQTGHAHLIEINPRTTQVAHLTLGAGRDLPAALYAAVSEAIVQPAPKVTEKDTIALFPQEWIRDSASPFLRSGYHDVPWDEPELVQACIHYARKTMVSKAQQVKDRDLSAIACPALMDPSTNPKRHA